MAHSNPQSSRHLLSVHDFHKMGANGILGEVDRVELIGGELIDMAPIGSAHAWMVSRITNLLIPALRGRAILSPQNPVRLSAVSELQPDIALLRPRGTWYRHTHPTPEDILLVVEVADTSLAYDRKTKAPLYANHGLPELWLIDLNSERIELHRAPAEDGYRRIVRPANTESISPQALPDVVLSLSKLWAERFL